MNARPRSVAAVIGVALSVICLHSAAQPAPVLRIEISGLSATQIKAAIDQELRGDASASGAEVRIGGDNKRATIRVKDRKGAMLERTIDLPSDPDKAARDIALLVGNLVRDQHAAILDLFRPAPSASSATPVTAPSTSATPARTSETTPAPTHAIGPASPVASGSGTANASAVAAPPIASNEVAHDPVPTASASVTSVAQNPPEARPHKVEAPHVHLSDCREPGVVWSVGGADLVPTLGTSSITGVELNQTIAFGVLGSFWRSTRALSLNGLAGFARKGACGLRLSGIGDVLIDGSMRGIHVGGLAALVGGDTDGLQIGGLFAATLGDFTGAQVGLLTVTGERMKGIQVGGATFANQGALGAQIGVGNISGARFVGVQTGVGNASDGVTGAQIGVVNVSLGDVRGAQIGVVNIAPNADAPIGLVNVMYRGHLGFQAVATESGSALALVEHGGRVIHTLYGGGARGNGSGFRGVLAMGFGTHILKRDWLWIDLDALFHVEPGSPWFDHQHQLTSVRLIASLPITRYLALMIAPTYNVLVTNDRAQTKLSPWTAYNADTSENAVRMWPGVTLGVRVF